MGVTERFGVRKAVCGNGVKSDLYITKITLRGVEDRLEWLSLQVKNSVRKVLETQGQVG